MCDPLTGQMFQRRCRSLRCYFCLPIQVWQTARAVALAHPNWFLTLTMAGDDFDQVRKRVNRFREYLKRAGVTFEWVWSVEPNPSGTGTHVHAWVRSEDDLLAAPVLDAAERAGFGSVVDADVVREPMGWNDGHLEGVRTAGYALKEAVSDAGSDALTETQERFLALNGERLCHTSRGFWVDEQGRPAGGLRGAVRRARQLARSARLEATTAPGTARAVKVPA